MFVVKSTVLSTRFFSCVTSCVVTSMEKHCIVPHVIDVAPEAKLKVIYPGGDTVNLGIELRPTDVKDIPRVEWVAQANMYYTLCMTDPDAPSRRDPKLREWHHWLVGNIPGSNVDQGETLSAYIGAAPPEDTGRHRYVFLIYKQPSKLNFDEPRLPNNSKNGRCRFSIRRFAKKYKLGHPIAGNFFVAKWDAYVPHIYRQLGA